MRILVTGSRDLPENKESVVWESIIGAAIELYGNGDSECTVIEGGCPTGADRYAREYVMKLADADDLPIKFHLETHKAEWEKYGRQVAGPRRNQEMVDAGADVCLAFFAKGAKNRGTKNCSDAAEKAGIPVKRIWV